MVGPLGEDVGIGVLEEQVVGRGGRGSKGGDFFFFFFFLRSPATSLGFAAFG